MFRSISIKAHVTLNAVPLAMMVIMSVFMITCLTSFPHSQMKAQNRSTLMKMGLGNALKVRFKEEVTKR